MIRSTKPVLLACALLVSCNAASAQTVTTADGSGRNSASTPSSAPPNCLPLTKQQTFERDWAVFFGWVDSISQVAKENRNNGVPGATTEGQDFFARVASISLDQADLVLQASIEYHRGDEDYAAKIREAAQAIRAKYSGEERKEQLQSDPQLNDLLAQQHSFRQQVVANLNEQLGSKAFAKVDAYRIHMFPPKSGGSNCPAQQLAVTK